MQPIEQCDRGSDVLPDDDGLAVGGVGVACALSQPAQQVPDGVAAQQVLFIGVGAFGDGGVDPVFESDHVLVAGGQDSRWRPGRCAGARRSCRWAVRRVFRG